MFEKRPHTVFIVAGKEKLYLNKDTCSYKDTFTAHYLSFRLILSITHLLNMVSLPIYRPFYPSGGLFLIETGRRPSNAVVGLGVGRPCFSPEGRKDPLKKSDSMFAKNLYWS